MRTTGTISVVAVEDAEFLQVLLKPSQVSVDAGGKVFTPAEAVLQLRRTVGSSTEALTELPDGYVMKSQGTGEKKESEEYWSYPVRLSTAGLYDRGKSVAYRVYATNGVLVSEADLCFVQDGANGKDGDKGKDAEQYMHRAYICGEVLAYDYVGGMANNGAPFSVSLDGYTTQALQYVLLEFDLQSTTHGNEIKVGLSTSAYGDPVAYVGLTGAECKGVWKHFSEVMTAQFLSEVPEKLWMTLYVSSGSPTVLIRRVRVTVLSLDTFSLIGGDYVCEYTDTQEDQPAAGMDWLVGEKAKLWRRVSGWQAARPRDHKSYVIGYRYQCGKDGEAYEDYLWWTQGGRLVSVVCTETHNGDVQQRPYTVNGDGSFTLNLTGNRGKYWKEVQSVDRIATGMLLAQRSLIKNLMVDYVESSGDGIYSLIRPGTFEVGVTGSNGLIDEDTTAQRSLRMALDGDGNGVLEYWQQGVKVGQIDKDFFDSKAYGDTWTPVGLCEITEDTDYFSPEYVMFYEFHAGFVRDGSGNKTYNYSGSQTPPASDGCLYDAMTTDANGPSGNYPKSYASDQKEYLMSSSPVFRTKDGRTAVKIFRFQDGKVVSSATFYPFSE